MVIEDPREIIRLRPNTLRALRPTREDDICLLLSSSDEGENKSLYLQQAELRSIFGGHLVYPVHLTCHRFEICHDGQLPILCQNLTAAIQDIRPFAITATSFLPLYSEFRQINLLKWRIQMSQELQDFVARVDKVLEGMGLCCMYPSGWVSSLVTALEDIPGMVPENELTHFTMPRLLFTADRVIFSRVKGPDKFDKLAQVSLQR